MSSCAIVTGGASGIGKACAQALGKNGVSVVLSWLKEQTAGSAVAAEIESSSGRALALQADVGDEEAVDALEQCDAEIAGAPDESVIQSNIAPYSIDCR